MEPRTYYDYSWAQDITRRMFEIETKRKQWEDDQLNRHSRNFISAVYSNGYAVHNALDIYERQTQSSPPPVVIQQSKRVTETELRELMSEEARMAMLRNRVNIRGYNEQKLIALCEEHCNDLFYLNWDSATGGVATIGFMSEADKTKVLLHVEMV